MQFSFGKSLSKIFMAFAFIVSLVFTTTAWAGTVTIPANTRIYVETEEPISGKKKSGNYEGQTVRATVWRDVDIDGVTVVKAGTPVIVRIDSLKTAKVAGVKGKITLGAYETTAVDNTAIQLGGGYYKEGKGRIALAATLAAVVFLPLIFIKGKAAKLPAGTVFDAYVDRTAEVEIPGVEAAPHKVNLSGIMGDGFDARVLYDELEKTDKPEYFTFAIQAPEGNSGEFVIDTLNGEKVKGMKLDSTKTGDEDGMEMWRGQIKIKDLAKKLKKGINTFEIATMVNGERVSKEIVLDIQI